MNGRSEATTHNRDAGHSLIELIFVLACTTTLLAAAVPNAGKLYQEWSLRGAASEVESSLRWGRMHASSANSPVIFVVDEGGKRFGWVDPESGARLESTVRYLPRNVLITGFPKKPLRFYPRGYAVPAGTYVVQGEAGVYRVVVNPAGRIRIQRG